MLIHADTSDTLTLAGRMKRFRAPGPIIVRQPYGTRGERRNSISPISLSLHGFAEPGGVSARLSAARGIAELRHGVMGIGADRFPSFCIERTPPLSLVPSEKGGGGSSGERGRLSCRWNTNASTIRTTRTPKSRRICYARPRRP